MMIGPEPMRRIFWISVRRGTEASYSAISTFPASAVRLGGTGYCVKSYHSNTDSTDCSRSTICQHSTPQAFNPKAHCPGTERSFVAHPGDAGRNASSNPFFAQLVPTLRVGTHWMAAPRPRNGTSTLSMSYNNRDAERPSSALRRWSVVTRAFNGSDEAVTAWRRAESTAGVRHRAIPLRGGDNVIASRITVLSVHVAGQA